MLGGDGTRTLGRRSVPSDCVGRHGLCVEVLLVGTLQAVSSAPVPDNRVCAVAAAHVC